MFKNQGCGGEYEHEYSGIEYTANETSWINVWGSRAQSVRDARFMQLELQQDFNFQARILGNSRLGTYLHVK